VTVSITVVCEASADKRTGCTLADRVISSKVDWIEPESLDIYRQWRGFRMDDPYMDWIKDVKSLAGRLGVRAHGHFDGAPAALEAGAVRRALLVIHASPDPPDAIVLLRDDDGERRRRVGFEQARNADNSGKPIVIGLAHTKRECWVLAAYSPKDTSEQQCVTDLGRELGFNPLEHSEYLTAKHDHDKRSAKRVLALLTAHDVERENKSCAIADPVLLKSRGKHNGLAEYIDEIEERLVPLFDPRPRNT